MTQLGANPLDMLVFAKVVERRSFSAAAQSLGISRSAVSRHVSRLEQSLGTSLLRRTTRNLSLTEIGLSVFAHCSRMAVEVEAADIVVQSHVRLPTGKLRVSVPGAFGRLHLMPAVEKYLSQHSDVGIELVMTDRQVDLVGEQIDVALFDRDIDRANIVGRKLANTSGAICAAPAYLKRVRAPTEPAELSAHNCVYYTSAGRGGDVWTLSRGTDVVSVRINGNFCANDSEAVRNAALSGLGVALIPVFAIARHVSKGRLVPLLTDWVPQGTFGSRLTAYFIGDRYPVPKIRTFIDFLARYFGPTPSWEQEYR
jgi:DNA-binding transcriptional LysR family regulator